MISDDCVGLTTDGTYHGWSEQAVAVQEHKALEFTDEHHQDGGLTYTTLESVKVSNSAIEVKLNDNDPLDLSTKSLYKYNETTTAVNSICHEVRIITGVTVE